MVYYIQNPVYDNGSGQIYMLFFPTRTPDRMGTSVALWFEKPIRLLERFVNCEVSDD